MRYDKPEEIKQILGELNPQQLWCLVKIAKHVRLRCRNNTAFNNYMNAIFPYAQFKQVTKTHPDGTTYPGLSIITKEGEANATDDDE